VWEKVKGPEHPEKGSALFNLASLYKERKNYIEAEKLYVKTLIIFEKTLGSDHPRMAVVMDSYAELLHEIGLDEQAEKIHARAKSIRDKAGTDNPEK